MNAAHENTATGWPEDERPIFIDAGFGTIRPATPGSDPLGETPRLSQGEIVDTDAPADEFTRAWSDILAEEPGGADRWEYALQHPGEFGDDGLEPMLLDAALAAVRTTPGARLQRRAVSRWAVMPTPFPRILEHSWGEVDGEKQDWFRALREFPPSYWGVISRQGGIAHVPEEWRIFARRAGAVGFTPADYVLLGTAHTAWRARAAESQSRLEAPALNAIEVWARFPDLVRNGASPLSAIERCVRDVRR